jgi:hypothetical protein
MKLHIDKDRAIKILEDRLRDLNSFDFDHKVWKDRTILDLKQIFGQLSDQWLQVNSIHFDTFVVSDKQRKLQEGKTTGRKLLNSYIEFIKEHSSIQQEKAQIEEETFRQKYRELLNDWNEFVPQYNSLLEEHKNTQEETESLYGKVAELELQLSKDTLTEDLFPIEILSDTRGYLENVAKQAILCYQNGLFDACLVMLRKLIEALIIESFEAHKIEAKIKGGDGFYFYLNDLIGVLLSETTWTITRNSQQAFPRIKKFADLSAHNRRFNAKKPDIDQIKDDLRIVIEELVHIAGFDKNKKVEE